MAENAGKRLQHMLQKMQSEQREEITWVELLPLAIRTQLDIPGRTGMSPHQLVTGREREEPVEPQQGEESAMTGGEYDTYSHRLQAWVAEETTKSHKHVSDRVNERRREMVSFEPGDRVWTIVPRTPIGPVGATKVDNRWYGPRLVEERLSEHTYSVQTSDNPAKYKDYHISQLKGYVDEALTGTATPLWYSAPRGKSTTTEEEGDPDKDYEVEKVLRMRVNERTGRREYEVKWVGYKDTTWEFMEGFILNPFGEYLGRTPDIGINFPVDWRTEGNEGEEVGEQ
jgi:hypothetical protein